MTRPQIIPFFPLLQPGSFQLSNSRIELSYNTTHWHPSSTSHRMDNLFIDALVAASSCRDHARSVSTQASISKPSSIYHKVRRRTIRGNPTLYRSIHTSRNHNNLAVVAQPTISRNEYIQMLDYYIEPVSNHATLNHSVLPMSAPSSPVIHKESIILGDKDSMTIKTDKLQVQRAIQRLLDLLKLQDCPNEEVMAVYSSLPFPGVSYLSDSTRRLLLRRMSVVEKKNQDNMLRYLSIVDDMKAAGLLITEAEWNSAIGFVGRCFSRVQAPEVESALQIWKEMEQEAKVKSGHVTFNILFDIATKAGKFVLAEMILKEMVSRNLPINRFARVGIIYYHGLKGDGEGVRKAYRALVDAGEIVDTVVMNCVITSLIRAGEPSAADQVYERMKRIHALKTAGPLPFHNWKCDRQLGRILDKAANVYRSDHQRQHQLQSEQSLCPNLRTYAILIEHHVAETGELRRVVALLDEMQSLGVPMHGNIFVKLFKGFATHGGARYTSWTKARLESVWLSLVKVLDESIEDVTVRKWMVVWVVRAFEKCCGRERTLQIWEELRARWKGKADEERAVFTLLRDILRKKKVHIG